MKIRLIIKSVILFIIICIASCAHHARQPEPWTENDKALMGTLIIGNMLDTMQTNDIYHRTDEFCEQNPIIDSIHDEFGMEGVIAYEALGTALIGTAAHYLTDWRNRILKISNIVIWSVVGHNYSIGLRFRF